MQNDILRVPSPWSQAAGFVHGKIQGLMNTGNRSLSRAALARLRRGIGKPPGSIPELWTYTLDGMPQQLTGRGGGPSWGEWSTYMALTLFALHQQGKELPSACVSKHGQSLGKAVRQLVKEADDMERVKRRFDPVVTADSPEELSHHLRGLVQLLKASEIPLDYPALARDLYRFLMPGQRDSVRLSWGRDFYAISRQSTDEKQQPIEEMTEEQKNDHEEE